MFVPYVMLTGFLKYGNRKSLNNHWKGNSVWGRVSKQSQTDSVFESEATLFAGLYKHTKHISKVTAIYVNLRINSFKE